MSDKYLKLYASIIHKLRGNKIMGSFESANYLDILYNLTQHFVAN